jgi:hypothetical protein
LWIFFVTISVEAFFHMLEVCVGDVENIWGKGERFMREIEE